jgi:hypothetical protein
MHLVTHAQSWAFWLDAMTAWTYWMLYAALDAKRGVQTSWRQMMSVNHIESTHIV